MDQPKIERLLRLMKMLTANTSYRVDDLAQRLSMSRRTIYRYIDTFREVGFVIKRDGEFIRLDKESPHFRDISQLVHFTEEEAVILRRSIESIDDTNMLKANLKRKLYSVYDNGTISQGRMSSQHSTNIHRLLEAISSRESVVLRRYKSAHASVVRDRRVEPFAFTTGYVQVWCFDLDDGCNKLFKSSRIGAVEPTGEGWTKEEQHREGYIDIFRMNGSDGEQITVSFEMGLLAYNLLMEEYPLAERDVEQIGDRRWRLTTKVANLAGVGRFVVGLIDDIYIVDSPELESYIHNFAKKFQI
ncbi:MAG: WYL domain-containing protein [Rikenellaceae bacterium]